jgi:hypothetical protein
MVFLSRHLPSSLNNNDADCSSSTVASESTSSLSCLTMASLDLSLTSLSFSAPVDRGTTSSNASLFSTGSNKGHPARRLQHSFRPGNSIGFPELTDIEFLDLSLHDERQQKAFPQSSAQSTQRQEAHHSIATGNTACYDDRNKPPQLEPTGITKRSPQKRQSPLAKFVKQRVDKFGNNILTIVLLLTGQREVAL